MIEGVWDFISLMRIVSVTKKAGKAIKNFKDQVDTYLTANSNTQDADMADSIRGVLRRSRINRVMKIEVNDKKSVGSVKANMVVRINVIVSSF